MNQLGLKILLKEAASGFMIVVMEAEKAKKIVRDWLSGQFKIKGVNRIGDAEHPAGGAWAVDLDSVSGMHTFDVTELQQQGRPGSQMGGPLMPGQFKGLSGAN